MKNESEGAFVALVFSGIVAIILAAGFFFIYGMHVGEASARQNACKAICAPSDFSRVTGGVCECPHKREALR